MRRFLDADESDDPILSVVNVIDVFLVIIVVLLIMVAQSSFMSEQEAIADASGDVIPREAEAMERYESTGDIGEGQGVRAGTTYRLDDGSLVFVPEEGD